jgi:hypothetical protein
LICDESNMKCGGASDARNSFYVRTSRVSGISLTLLAATLIVSCGSSESPPAEPAATDKASSVICAKLGSRLIDDQLSVVPADISAADRSALRANANLTIGTPFMDSCIGKMTVAQVQCGVAAKQSDEIAACIAMPVAAPVAAPSSKPTSPSPSSGTGASL